MAKKLTAMQKYIMKNMPPSTTLKKGEDFYFDHYPEYALQLLLCNAIDAMCHTLVKGGMQKKEMPAIKDAIWDCLLLPGDKGSNSLITYDDNYEKKCRKEFRKMTPKQITAFEIWLKEFNEG